MRLLLERGADVKLRDENGCSPLMWTTKRSYELSQKIVQLLLDHGADPADVLENDFANVV